MNSWGQGTFNASNFNNITVRFGVLTARIFRPNNMAVWGGMS